MQIAHVKTQPQRKITEAHPAHLVGRPGPTPPQVRTALEAGVQLRRFLYPEVGPVKTVEVWSAPQINDKTTGTAIWERLEALEVATYPGARGEIMSRVLVLLSHFRQQGHSAAVEQGIADDWAEDLAEFPMWAIDEAARSWRRTQKFKPQIVEIIELCRQACGEVMKERDRLRAIVDTMAAARNPFAGQARALARGLFETMRAG